MKGDDGDGGVVMHDGSGILRCLETAAGCYCCFHFLHWWKAHWCPRLGGGGAARGSGCCGDGCSHCCWSHGCCCCCCSHGGTEFETRRWMKGMRKAASNLLWFPPHHFLASPLGRPVLSSPYCPDHCSSAYRAGE